MRNRGNILIMPGKSEREKKVSAFKTISFLVSSPENESVSNFSNHLREDEGDHENVPDRQSDRNCRGGCEEDTGPRENTAFPDNDEDNFPQGMCTEDVTAITVSYPSAGEKRVPVSSPAGTCYRNIPPEKNDSVNYPGRSVLYSRQFRPLDRIITTDYNNPRLGEQ
jgi:hypothetical protein